MYTNSTTVTLALDASSIYSDLSSVEMSIEQNENSTWTTWIPYDSTISLNLSNLDGEKNVYVRFRLMRHTSEIFQDSITLDTTPPSLDITSPPNASKINSPSAQINWTASDMGSGLSNIVVVDKNGNIVNVGTNTTYEVTELTNGSYTFVIEAIDNAGNTATTSLSFDINLTAINTASEDNLILWALIGAVAVGTAIILTVVFRKKKTQKNDTPKPTDDKSVIPMPLPKPVDDKSVLPIPIPKPVDDKSVLPLPIPKPADDKSVIPITIPKPKPVDDKSVLPVPIPKPVDDKSVLPLPVPKPADDKSVIPITIPKPKPVDDKSAIPITLPKPKPVDDKAKKKK